MSNPNLRLILLGAAVGVAAVVAATWLREAPAPRQAGPPVPAATPAVSPEPPPPAPGHTPPGDPPRSAPPPPPAVDKPPSYAGQFHEADDYLEFARSMLAKARAGDLDAQFHLYSAIEYCRDNYREYFDHGRQRRSLDEALRRAATRPGFDADEIRQVHGRCQKLMESTDNELGEGEQWLQKAALGGHPRAQVHLATELMTHSGNLPAEEARKSQEDARRLVRDALRSRDPAVIWDVGPMAMLGNPGDQPDMEVMAWWLAACDRGLDCGASSDRARQMCRFAANCQPYESVGDLMLRSVPDYAAVKDRARQINALIDAGDPQALGFGAATSGQ